MTRGQGLVEGTQLPKGQEIGVAPALTCLEHTGGEAPN